MITSYQHTLLDRLAEHGNMLLFLKEQAIQIEGDEEAFQFWTLLSSTLDSIDTVKEVLFNGEVKDK